MLDYVSIDMYVYVTMYDVHVYDTIQLRTPLLFLLCQLRRLMYLKKNPCPRPTLHWIKLLNHNMWYAVTRTIWWCVLSFWCFQKPCYFRKINIFDTIYMICRVRYEHKLNIFFILCSLFDVFISHTYVRLKVFRLDNLKMIQIFWCAIFAYWVCVFKKHQIGNLTFIIGLYDKLSCNTCTHSIWEHIIRKT